MPTTVQLLLVDQFLRTFQESNKVPEQEMLDAINAQLEGIRQCVRASLTKQEELLSDLQTKFEAYFGRKKSAESSSLISQLTAAVDSFLALDRDVKEGMKFYAELTDRCLKVQDKVCQSIFFHVCELHFISVISHPHQTEIPSRVVNVNPQHVTSV